MASLFNGLFRFLAAVFKGNQASGQSLKAHEMDNTHDKIEKAIQDGTQNLEILRLAANWCENIDYTRGPFGVGLVEEATGLPISGGSLRCDFAKVPQSFGHKLARSALAFYVENCIGCSDQVATNATEHLGTWAEEQIAEREKREAEAALAQHEARKACEKRAAHRRFLHGQSEPASQSILDLLDRVDDLDNDPDAEQLLVQHAKMAPGDFPDALLDHLVHEAMAIGNNAFLEAACAVFERQGRPETDAMLGIAFLAVEKDIAREAAGHIIAVHAHEFDVETSSLSGLVRLAAGRTDHRMGRQVDAKPAALLRFFDCQPGKVVKLISGMLQVTDVRLRAQTAHAAETLVAARPEAGTLILPALLGSLSHPDRSQNWGDPFAARQATRVVAHIFIANPRDTDTHLEVRIGRADLDLAKKLWSCFYSADPSRFREQVPQQVTDITIRRALLLLAMDRDMELLRDVADTLSSACLRENLKSAPLTNELVRLVELWSMRRQEIGSHEPTANRNTARSIELWREGNLVSAILNRIQTALKRVAEQDPHAYISAIASNWNIAEAHALRACFLEVFQALVRDQEKFNLALPLLRHSLESRSPREKAAALSVIGRIRSPDVSVPKDLVARVLEAFGDERLIVLFGAIRAGHCVEIPGDRKRNLIPILLDVISTCGPQFLYRNEVAEAIRLALHLAEGESFQDPVAHLILDSISALPSGEVTEFLRRLNLEDHPAWPSAALNALRPDPRPAYQDLGYEDHEDHEDLLRKLAERSGDELAGYFNDLVNIASDRLTHKPWWGLAVADILALHQEHERAAALTDKVVDTLPNTPERRPTRNSALLVAFEHRVNAAMARGDRDSTKRALAEWTQLLAEENEIGRMGQNGKETDRQDSLRVQLEIRKTVAGAVDAIESGKKPNCSLPDLSQKLLNEDCASSPRDDRWALSAALRSLGMAVSWEPAVELADGNASAYCDASRLIAQKTLASNRKGTWSVGVIKALKILAHLEAFADVPRAAASLQRAPIVYAATNLLAPPSPVSLHQTQSDPTVTPTVHLRFTLNDQPISWPMALQAGRYYKFGVTVTGADWPRHFDKIDIEWKTKVPESILTRSGFTIAPEGETSHEGYLLARAEIPPDPGVDMTPEVTIHELNGSQSAARVVGQRSLRINTFVPSEIGTGLPMVGQRIIELLAELNARIPTLPIADRLNLLHLLDATSRFAALAIERKELCHIDEKGFQRELKQALVFDQRIGRRIQEGSKLGGGESDLVLERLVNELKVSPTTVTFEQARRFIGQSTQYASAGDCPISVLTILDQSPKSDPPSIQSNNMAWAFPPIHSSGLCHTPSMVAIIIIPVGFPVPSTWSRPQRNRAIVASDGRVKAQLSQD